MEEIIKPVDDFEGKTFKTKKDATLTVQPWEGDRRGSHKYYPVTCSICSKDYELSPENFLCKKSDIVKGVIPCGCGSYNYNGDQQKIILNRVFMDEKPHLTCIGWRDGEFKNCNSRPVIFCSKHKTTNVVSRISHLRTGQVAGCEYCSIESRRSITCTPLSYAMENLQLHFDNIGGEFISFDGDYKGLSTYVNWRCNNGHEVSTLLESLIKNKNNCVICKGNGFQGAKSGYLYLTRFISSCGYDGFYKIGVSNKDPKIRNRRQSNFSAGYKESPIASIFFESGYDALLLEQDLVNRYADGYITKAEFEDGYTETFKSDGLTEYDLQGDFIYMTGCSIFNNYTQCKLPVEQNVLKFKSKFWLVYPKTLEKVKEDVWE